jgi:glycosyltransferase involved in cell wall biosynthesis
MSRIVWFHPRQLLPPRGGGEFRSAGLVQGALAAGHEVLLVHPDDGPEYDEPLPDLLQVTTVTLRTGLSRAAAKVFSRDPLRAPRASRSSMAQARRDIEEFLPDLAIVSQVMSWSLARRLLPDVPWVYDSHNVEHELFESHLAAATTLGSRLTFRVDAARVARAERRMLETSTLTLAVSPGDAASLTEAASLQASPVVVPSSMTPPSATVTPALADQKVLFVGTLDFPPNVEAIHDLVDHVMPRVVAVVPAAKLLVAGRHPSRDMRALLASQPWIEFVENAPDIAQLYQNARCAALPFRSGSGTKLKLYEALAHGLPVVATPKAIAGVDVMPDDDILMANDHSGFADAVRGLLEDEQRAAHVGAAGRRAFDARLSWEQAAHPILRDVLEQLG